MFIICSETGERIEAIIEHVFPADYKIIKTSKRFPDFVWDKEKTHEVVKIRAKDPVEILGLMSLIDFSAEMSIKINLLQTSAENVGHNKKYERIAGCLIAYACKQAFIRGYDGTVALEPKTELARHYMEKYGMQIGGKHLYTELANSEHLIREYLNHES
jgi:hypothetical protein